MDFRSIEKPLQGKNRIELNLKIELELILERFFVSSLFL
jgi:hypothetical protein